MDYAALLPSHVGHLFLQAPTALSATTCRSGVSYFANIGPNWDVAVTAAESDNHANIIQRPRIQTSQAKPAQFFVGNTVPYVTGTYNGYSGYGGNSYSQLSVGVELDVTPFINPEGLVVMDISRKLTTSMVTRRFKTSAMCPTPSSAP